MCSAVPLTAELAGTAGWLAARSRLESESFLATCPCGLGFLVR